MKCHLFLINNKYKPVSDYYLSYILNILPPVYSNLNLVEVLISLLKSISHFQSINISYNPSKSRLNVKRKVLIQLTEKNILNSSSNISLAFGFEFECHLTVSLMTKCSADTEALACRRLKSEIFSFFF